MADLKGREGQVARLTLGQVQAIVVQHLVPQSEFVAQPTSLGVVGSAYPVEIKEFNHDDYLELLSFCVGLNSIKYIVSLLQQHLLEFRTHVRKGWRDVVLLGSCLSVLNRATTSSLGAAIK